MVHGVTVRRLDSKAQALAAARRSACMSSRRIWLDLLPACAAYSAVVSVHTHDAWRSAARGCYPVLVDCLQPGGLLLLLEAYSLAQLPHLSGPKDRIY